ncbi:hypothetical protein Poli38472_002893 [Pythium oligandrum]|uniref:Chromodomain-helicase-DNA-binding protein 7 n=1 Tax=Pythium oligandrum TaxID=41045 RepID=A0A8K1FFM6_PYTOL|nr:hypothetical protein Poli38472_002893 [Pythium oligandrum]|eukprot:TMW56968.1 hypothetical protein Poli38472_002893 [Pythium oligandrum]
MEHSEQDERVSANGNEDPVQETQESSVDATATPQDPVVDASTPEQDTGATQAESVKEEKNDEPTEANEEQEDENAVAKTEPEPASSSETSTPASTTTPTMTKTEDNAMFTDTKPSPFQYGSSNFVASTPTPIRPIPGDPRMQQQQAVVTGSSATVSMAPSYSNATATRMFTDVTSSQSFYNTPQEPANPVAGVVDPTMSSFEAQWNQASTVPMAAKWSPGGPSMPSGPQPNGAAANGANEQSLPPMMFPARSLVPLRVDDSTYAYDPSTLSRIMQAGKSVGTPTQAASFAVDLLRAADAEVGAHGWRVPYQANEYEVLLQKGSIGLCMNMSVRMGCVTVTSFRRPEGGVIGPAEASGMIHIGDDLVAVDGFRIQSPDDFTKVVGRLKSLRPVLLRFRRPGNVPIDVVQSDMKGFRRGLRQSMAGLDNSEHFTSGLWHMGVRYIAPNQWAAELHVDGGGIRRIGVFASEREAAMVYNRYIHQTYGNSAAQFMNPAGTNAAMDTQGGISVATSNVRDMKPIQRPVRRKAAFTNEQKEQLRAQIMVFKFTSTGGNIPGDLLSRALKQVAPAHIQDTTEKKKRKTFAAQPVAKPTKKKAKRGGRKKKKMYSDESDDESDSDGAFRAAPPPREIAPTRRSGRNVGKAQKSYVEKETNSDFEFSDDEKPQKAPEEPEEPKGPQIDKIVGVRFHKESADDDETTMQFLIKWKDVSYLHLTWLSTSDIEDFGHHSIMRMRRYMQKHSRDVEQARDSIVVGEERDYSSYFSESFLEVDRILNEKEVEEPEQVNPFKNHGAGEDGTPKMKRGKKYLVKWRDLSYVDCSWEWEDELTDDRKIAAYHRHNHPPIVNGAHPAMFEDIRPDPSSWAKYQESPVYNNQNTLRPYQLEGLNWMVFCWYNRRNCILADEMGLGKTVQATSILEHLRQREHIRGPFLVIAPLATLGNWKREIETWTSMNCVVYHDSEGGADIRAFIREQEFYFPNESYKRRGIYKFNVLVTSYQTLMADAEYLDTIRWRYIVIDEAHKLKNREAKLLQCLHNFSWDSCLLMTGTPLQNGVFELWCLLNFIEPEKFPSQQEFYDEYGELNTAEQVARLHEQLRPYMLRRVKEDVEKSIPPKEETIIDVELTTLQKKYYRAIFERNRSFLNMGSAGTVANLVNVEMELRKCCNHPFLIRGVEEKECGHYDEQYRAKILVQASGKTVLLDKMLTKFRAEKKKILIFSQFKIMLDIIEDLCQMRGYSIERMDGSVRGNSRQAAIDRFNNPDSDTFAFLLSTRAGGVGINLIAASVVILFDSDWNPQNDLQAVARCHRIGQTQSVNIYRLVTKKTYEAQMFDIASKKLGMHHAVFETGGVRNEFDGDDEGGNMMSLMSLDREKVEMMIRYGAYAIMGEDDEHDPENRAINELDIDQLLSASRTIRYDPTGGENAADGEGEDGDGEAKQPTVSQSSALSFSKATFTAESSDTTIDFNDEQFWEKVLGPKPVQQLMTKVQEGWLSKATKDEIKEYLTELRELARQVVQERQRGGTMADADQVMSILIELKVTGPVLKGVVNVRSVASEWLEVIERPKRRRNQDAESELMYLEFLDGTKKQPVTKKSASGGRRSKAKESTKKRETTFESDDEFDQDEDEEPSTPVRKPKRTKRQSSGGSSSSSKTDIRIFLQKDDDDEYSVVRVHSSIKKIQKQLPKDSSAPASAPTTPTSKSRKPKPSRAPVVEENDDQGSDSGAEDELMSEDDKEKDPDADEDDLEPEEDEDDDDEDDNDDEDYKKPSRRRKRNGKTESECAPKPKPSGTIDPQVDEDMWCRVCFSDTGSSDDPIVQCERCKVAVHQYCYGIEKIPEGDIPWFCDYCGDSDDSATNATCALCPLKRKTSAFKKTLEGDWVHVVCALWAPGVQFADVEHMKDIKNVPDAIKETRGEQCALCDEKDGCIKCFRGSCLTHFHPLCGRESKGDFDMYMNETGQLRAFCPKHRTRAKRS